MKDNAVAFHEEDRLIYTLGYLVCAMAKDLDYESPYCLTRESPSAPTDIGDIDRRGRCL